MPRLVGNTVRILARKTHPETVKAGVTLKPTERGRHSETFFERRLAGRTHIDGATGVMLAESGSGIHGED